MPELESPTCALDLRDPSNALNIAMAEPGKEIRVLVRLEDDAKAQILATGTLSNDGKSFSVIVKSEDGAQQTHDLCYRDRLRTFTDLSNFDVLQRSPLQTRSPNKILAYSRL